MNNAAPPEEDLNYALEMFRHPTNVWGLCGALVVGSVAAVASGIAPALLIPVVAQAGLNGILALFLPESPVFRQAISRRKRKERREAARGYLGEEIGRRVPGSHAYWAVYHRMREQLADLERVARDEASDLSPWDVERLDHATVEYLRLWLARILLGERADQTQERPLRAQIEQIEHQLKGDLGFADRQRLERARDDLSRVLDRRRGFGLQEQSLSAKMLALTDAFAELHARVLANPTGEDLGAYLQTAVDRMTVTDELDHAAESELAQALALSRGAREAVATALAQDQRLDAAMQQARTADLPPVAAARKER